MGNQYAWIKVRITTNNRDRRGGHDNTFCKDALGYNEPHSPHAAKFHKRRTRRDQRREHNRITADAVREYYDEVREYYDELERMMVLYDDDYSGYSDWDDYNDPDPRDSYDYCEEDYLYGGYEYGDDPDDYFTDLRRKTYDLPNDYTITKDDVGKTIGDLKDTHAYLGY